MPPKSRGCGEMVDTTDLKSVGFAAVRVQVPPSPISDEKYILKNNCVYFFCRTFSHIDKIIKYDILIRVDARVVKGGGL